MIRAHRRFSVCCSMALLGAMAAGSASLPAADAAVGFIAAAPGMDKLGAEAKAAWALAAESGATLVLVPSDGKFVDDGGQDVALGRFQVLWYHEGDTSERTAVAGARSFPMLRKFVTEGGRLFLSGAAPSLVHTLGVEPAALRQGGAGQSPYLAGILPVVAHHPVFRGLAPGGGPEGSPILINDGGHPAFADYSGSAGPTTGMLLGRANCGDENPLVEYQLGTGRIIVLGWRLPHYSNAANPHRANLEQLTDNILAYLGDASQWQKIVVTPTTSLRVAEVGIPDTQWKSLDLAIRDLGETFGARYPRAAEYSNRLAELRQRHDAILAAIKQSGKRAEQQQNAAGDETAHAQELAEIVEQFTSLRYACAAEQSARAVRAALAGRAHERESGAAGQLGEQFEPEHHGHRQPCVRARASPARRRAGHTIPAAGRAVRWRPGPAFRRRPDAVLDARRQRALAGPRTCVGRSRRCVSCR